MLIEKIGEAAMLEQTAEECTELAQACLKMAREIRGENPTFKDMKTVSDNLHEEIADLMVCIAELESEMVSRNRVDDWMRKKVERMAKRLNRM